MSTISLKVRPGQLVVINNTEIKKFNPTSYYVRYNQHNTYQGTKQGDSKHILLKRLVRYKN